MKSLLILFLWPTMALAQSPLSHASMLTLRFDGADGLSVPAPFQLNGSGVPGTFGGRFIQGVTVVSNVRVYAYVDPSDADVVAYGFKRGTTTTSAFIEATLTNTTGRSLRRVVVYFRVWQISENQRATKLRLAHYRYPHQASPTNASQFVKSQEYAASVHTPERVLGTYVKRWLEAEIVFQTPIPDQETFVIGFNIANGDGSSGNAHLAIEEVRVFPDFAHRPISENVGWRMLSVPFSGISVRKFSEQFEVQGIPGLSHSAAAPNLYTSYDGTSWITPATADQVIQPGSGMIWYRFAGPAFDPGLFGHEPQSDVTIPLHSNGNRWNLLGNPYASPISVSAISSNGGFVPTVQVWQPAGSGSLGSWVLSSDPSLNGVIAPWQAFMLQTTEQNPGTTLTIPLSAKASGASGFFKDGEMETYAIPIELVKLEGNRTLRHDRGPMIEFRTVPSPHISRLMPLDSGTSYGWFRGSENREAALSSIDVNSQEDVIIPYDLHLSESGIWRIRWSDEIRIPDHWSVRFHDLELGVELDLRESEGYGFSHDGAQQNLRGRFQFVAKRIESVGFASSTRPISTRLIGSWPNPFNPTTVIGYQVSEPGDIRLSVYDILGREVAVLAQGIQTQGSHHVVFEATSLSSGVYVVRLQSSGSTAHHLITLIK